MITPSPLHNSVYHTATKTPMIASLEEEVALIVRAKDGDAQATHRLVTAYMRLILSLARGFAPNADPNDLVNEGVVGFMRAIERYDVNSGYRLGTYARAWILERLKEHTGKVRSIVGMGSTSERKRGLYHLGKAMDRELRDARIRGEHTTYHQILERAAARVGVSVPNAQDIMARAGGDMSLNTPVGGDEGESFQWQDLLVDDDANPESSLHARQSGQKRAALIAHSMEMLNARERRIIMERRLSDNPVTLDALGLEFNISKERVRQIEARALQKMAEALADQRNEALSLF